MITGTSSLSSKFDTQPYIKFYIWVGTLFNIHGTHNMGIPLVKIYPALVQYTWIQKFILRIKNVYQNNCTSCLRLTIKYII